MQSRKSSILKPRKVREPLQDLNQLLPNNDDEETTTTDAQRRKVSFASMNRVKEFEIASECNATVNGPCTYDKRYSLSTDPYLPAISEKNANETCQVTSLSRKSFQNSFKSNPDRQSIVDENVYVEEDVELTETIGRIYDIPMKSSGDSSMEITNVITQTAIQFDEQSEEIEEVMCPLNLTKENSNHTSSFVDGHIVEIEIVDKNEKDADTSSMETTEVISNNLITIERPDTSNFSVEASEVVSSPFTKNENDDTSSMETTEVIYDNILSASIKGQSAFYETLQSSRGVENTENLSENVEYLSVRDFGSPIDLPKRKSIFDVKFNSSVVKTSTQETGDKTKYDILSMQLMSQEPSVLPSIQNENKTKPNDSSLELLTQEDQTRYPNSSMEVLTQDDNKTKYNNSNMQIVSQEDNKTKYFNTSMQLQSQNESETVAKCNHDLTSDEINFLKKSDLTRSFVELQPNTSHPEGITGECEHNIVDTRPENPENTSSRRANEVDLNELCAASEVPHETTLRSSLSDDSNPNDSNSPLTVGVNFSIFQKNKETRVEFSGTIDSNKKKKSISNVKVNIINNKTEKKSKHVRELRFSMPATSKVSEEPENKKPDFFATFTDVSVPHDCSNSEFHERANIEAENDAEKCGLEYVQSTSKKSTEVVVSNTLGDTDEDRLSNDSSKTTKKRLSADAFLNFDTDEIQPKRRSLSNDTDSSVVVPQPLPTTETAISTSSAQIMKHSFTEIKQRKESFVREEKSVLSINDLVVETCSRSTNMNVSYESRHLVAVSDFADEAKIKEESSNNLLSTSSASSANFDSKANSIDASKEVQSENESDQSFAAENCSRNQSSQEGDAIDYSLHNPSIIVNIGDSFSHYKSMDLDHGNVSATDDRELKGETNEIKPVTDYIDSDDISKENFVVEWLQHKTGKINTDNRLFTSSTDSSIASTVKSVIRGSEKSSVTNVLDSDTKFKLLEMTKIKTTENHKKENNETHISERSSEINDEITQKPKNKDDEVYIDSEKIDENMQKEENKMDIHENLGKIDDSILEGENVMDISQHLKESEESASEEESETDACEKSNEIDENVRKEEKNKEICEETKKTDDEMQVDSDLGINENVSSAINVINDPVMNDDKANPPPFVDNSKQRSIDADPIPVITESSFNEVISCSGYTKRSKSTNNSRLSVDPVFVRSESTSEKRQKMSPEYEKDKIRTEQIIRSPDILETATENKKDNFTVKKNNQLRNKKIETTKKDILQRIESLSKNGNQKWKLKIASNEKWVFQFFYDQMELTINFDDDEEYENACFASCEFVQPPYIKYYEISKIAAEYLIRKNKSKLKKICRTVEDVPYLLKLIEPDVTYVESFVADILKLCDSEIFKIKNGRAIFYVYSFKNLITAKIRINITRLERLSIKDIQVDDIVGKSDLNLIRNTFSEAGRDSDFFSKFVKKLWIVLDE